MTGMYDQDGTFPELLAAMRWSQADFSVVTGVPLRTVKRWAREDDRSPGKRMAIEYLKVLVRLVGVGND